MARGAALGRRAGANLARAVRRVLARGAMPVDTGVWLVVRLSSALDELPSARFGTARESGLGLLDVLETLEAAASDPQVDGVLLRFHDSPGGWSKIQSLRRAVSKLRESGVPVAAYADSLDTEGLLIASAADRIWLPEAGSVFLVGLRAESFFLRDLLANLDVRPEIVRIGDYKSAAERLTRERMSPEEREQVESLVDDLFSELVAGLANGRGLDEERVRELIDSGPHPAPVAAAAGLVDGCLYPDEVEAELERLSRVPPTDRPGPRRVNLVEASVYHALRVADRGWRPLRSALPRVAYVVAGGAIQRGSGLRGISSERFAQLLEGIRRDEEVRGVVLRVDSPGGDGVASDLLWRSVSRMTREKPVVVSMGDVAASGGYYLAAAADAVFAESGTVTGSIGVVGGKLNLEGLYKRVGVAKDAVERGARAGLLSEARGFTEDERAAVRETMSALYATFLDRVAQGRGLSLEAVGRIAGGRVWSGARAQALGLVDALGGPLEALDSARERAGLRKGERVLVDRHPRVPSLPGLSALFGRVRGGML